MDKWMEKDISAFGKLMEEKGYTTPFLINGGYSGDLIPAITKTVERASEQGFPLFPLVIHTFIKIGSPYDRPMLSIRVDEGDEGFKIRDAELEGIKVKGVPKPNMNISFASTAKFPTHDQLIEKLNTKFSHKKSKRLWKRQ